MTPARRTTSLGAGLIIAALGVLGQSVVTFVAGERGVFLELLYWVSLTLIFVGPMLVVVSRRVSAVAATWLVLLTSELLLLSRFVLYPTRFVYHDELIHVASLFSIDSSHHLFGANSLLPAAAYYSGLEVATDGIHNLTGLSMHAAGIVVLVLARGIGTLALIKIVQRITGNQLAGNLAALVYATNPQNNFFNSQFSYQSLALPLSMFCVYVFTSRFGTRERRTIVVSLAVVAAVAVTHHLTSAALVVLLVGWWIASRLWRKPVPNLGAVALGAGVVVAGWTLVARNAVVPYMSEIVQNNWTHLMALLRGQETHKFFSDAAGDHTPNWERAISLVSVLMLTVCLLAALWYLRRSLRYWTGAFATLTVIACLYPLIPAGHLTNDTSEVADRSSGFIFVGLGFLLGVWWVRVPVDPAVLLRRRHAFFRSSAVLITGLSVSFIGGTIVGSGPPWLRGPGPYLVSADNRSVDPLALDTASWLGANLPVDQRVFSDRVNGLLAGVYGRQHVVTSLADHVDLQELSRTLLAYPDQNAVQTLKLDRVQYVIADSRLATSLPHVGIYIDAGEYQSSGRTAPPPLAAFTQLDVVPGAERIYDNGSIRVYDVRYLR